MLHSRITYELRGHNLGLETLRRLHDELNYYDNQTDLMIFIYKVEKMKKKKKKKRLDWVVRIAVGVTIRYSLAPDRSSIFFLSNY